ncbi:hypothetical protein AK812_SmicGene23996 [Symbiodinium microadriaticum]|uniref:Uncharacterized protein n=1 Tax=Symbiodinium microadriaticum TaxID=2951 RepID=A0A1Q9DFU9_SYMMI|nr:hypothetical protein AK812_SmicGene23996 [Symbiodinium microadriaticum]
MGHSWVASRELRGHEHCVTCGASVQSHSTSGRWRKSKALLDSFLGDRSWGSRSNLKSSQAWCSARSSATQVVQVSGIPWKAALDILGKVREDRIQEDATLLATVAAACDANQPRGNLQPILADVAMTALSALSLMLRSGANAKRASCPNTPIPKTGKYVKPHLKEVYKFFRDEWVNCNVFRSPGPMQLDSSGDVGPLSERPITLLADYFSVDELKQIVQPRAQPAPLVMCKEPLVVRDVRLRENLSLLEQERLNYEPALPGYLRDRVTWQEDELAPHSCDNIEELVQSFPLIHSHVCAIRLVPPIAAEGDEVETLMSERSPTSTMRQTAAASDCGKPMTVGIVFASSQNAAAISILEDAVDAGGPCPPLCGHWSRLQRRTLAMAVGGSRRLRRRRPLPASANIKQLGDLEVVRRGHEASVGDLAAYGRHDGSLVRRLVAAFVVDASVSFRNSTINAHDVPTHHHFVDDYVDIIRRVVELVGPEHAEALRVFGRDLS